MKKQSTFTAILLLYSINGMALDIGKSIDSNLINSRMILADASSYAECYSMAKEEHSRCISNAESYDPPTRNDKIEACNRMYDDRVRLCR